MNSRVYIFLRMFALKVCCQKTEGSEVEALRAKVPLSNEWLFQRGVLCGRQG